MRSRRKPWPSASRRAWLTLVILSSCLFTYVIFLCISNLHAAPARHLPLLVLDWLHSSPDDDPHRHDKNSLDKDFEFVIRVLAFNRLEPLRRCLRSLAAADYGGDRVDLLILVDHFESTPPTRRRYLSAENSTLEEEEQGLIDEFEEEGLVPEVEPEEEAPLSDDPVERSLQQARRMLGFLDKFRWRHGSKHIHYRAQNLGLQGQWLESWWPASDHQFALIVEDDMQLSPLFYRYVRSIIANFYYNPANFDPSIFGVTLQRPRFVPGKHGSKLELENSTRLFLYQMVGSWGQVLFPKPWREFRLWFDDHKARKISPIIEGMKTSDWYRRRGENLWTPWFTKFAQTRGYFNIYTNFLRGRALSVSHRAPGVNYKREAGPDSELIRRRGVSDVNLWEMPPLSSLAWYDYCFHRVFPNRVANDSRGVQGLLSGVHSGGEVLLVSIIGVEEGVVRNWLCQVDSVGVRNILLVAREGVLPRELARRGYAVVLIGGDSSLGVLQRVVELGYSAWYARPELSWVRTSLAGLGRGGEIVAAVAPGEGFFHSGLLFVRSCDNVKRMLSRFGASAAGDLLPGKALWEAAAGDRKVEIGKLEASFRAGNVSDSGILLFSGEATSEGVAGYLKSLELWIVDEELACKRVSCK